VQYLCADGAYLGLPARLISWRYGYQLRVKTRHEEREAKRADTHHKARRWVVERGHSWFYRFRKLLVSYEKSRASYEGLLALAAALICWRRTITIYG
jgi:transposase